MACRNRELCREEGFVSVSEALLLATVSILGYPVEAHLKDGSIYSGTFYTASVENKFGIVLKNASVTKKGKCASNVTSGDVIKTLVVLSADLVKVVSEGITLRANGVACNVSGDPFEVIVNTNEEIVQKEEDCGAVANERQIEDEKMHVVLVVDDKKSDNQKEETIHDVQSTDPSGEYTVPPVDSRFTQSKSVEEIPLNSSSELLPNGKASHHAVSSSDKMNDLCQPKDSSEGIARSNGMTSRVSTSHASTGMVPPKNSTTSSKGFKLNPGARLFCPSVSNYNPVTPPPVPSIAANLTYVPDNFTVGPIASPPLDVEINPYVLRSSPPVKFVQYGNSVAVNGFSDSEYSQPFIGHVGTRSQAVRYVGQHLHSIHTSPACVTTTPQNVMVGRGGQQLVYVHPASHDVSHAAAAFPQVSTRSVPTPHHLLKHQGTVAAPPPLQLYVTPSFMSSGQQQPIAVQSHSSHTPPPFPVFHQLSVPGSNGIYTAKF